MTEKDGETTEVQTKRYTEQDGTPGSMVLRVVEMRGATEDPYGGTEYDERVTVGQYCFDTRADEDRADRLVRTVRRHALCRSVEGQERMDAMEEALNKTDMTVRESMTVTCVLRDKYDGTVRVEAHEGTFEVDV